MAAAVSLTPLNPLSVPKGVKLADELTGEPAKFVAMIGGNSFYYSSQASFQLDFDGVLSKIAPLLTRLSTLAAMVGTAAERTVQARKVKDVQREIAAVCENTAHEHLVHKDFELAVPPALRCLRTLLALHGEGAEELVPAYLVLAEVNLGLSRIAQADEFLSTANYILVKHPDANALLRSRLHRNFGRMHAAQGNNAAALEAFSRDVYYGTMVHGPESIDVSIGYFFMAQVMAAQAAMENSLVLFDKVVDVWYKHLLGERSAISVALGVDFRVKSPEAYLGDARATGFLERSKAAESSAAEGSASAASTSSLGLGASGSAASLATSGAAAPAASGAGAASGAADGKSPSATATSPTASAAAAGPVTPPLTETQIREGVEMLEFITHVRATQLGPQHISTAEARYTHGLILQQTRRTEECRALLTEALAVFSLHLVSLLGARMSGYAVIRSRRAFVHMLLRESVASFRSSDHPGTIVRPFPATFPVLLLRCLSWSLFVQPEDHPTIQQLRKLLGERE